MRFDNGQALGQFLKEGAVATLRTYPYKARQNVIINKTWKAEIYEVFANPTSEILDNYVQMSGFDSVGEWTKEAERLHKRVPSFLVIVKKRIE
jgi:hypothetical protein